MRVCTKCSESKPEDDYYKPRDSWCKDCRRAAMRARTAERGDEINARRRARLIEDPEYAARKRVGDKSYWTPQRIKARNVRQSYGITVEEYDRLMALPCGCCGGLAQHLDHDHVTGAIRGPLCAGCNLMLGHAKDDPDRLRAGAAYIEAHLAKTKEG